MVFLVLVFVFGLFMIKMLLSCMSRKLKPIGKHRQGQLTFIVALSDLIICCRQLVGRCSSEGSTCFFHFFNMPKKFREKRKGRNSVGNKLYIL